MPKQHKRKADRKPNRLFRETINCHLHLPLLLAALLLSGAIVAVSVPLSYNRINNETNSPFPSSWRFSLNGNASVEIALPASLDLPCDTRVTLENCLPDQAIEGATVLLRTSQQDVEVCIEHERVYTSRNRKSDLPAPSSAYHFVRLPSDCAGKEISIVLTSPLKNYAGLLSQVYIGSKASNLFFLLRENGLRFVIGFLIFTIGFLLMTVFLFAKGQKNKMAIIYLGAFFTCAGYWVAVESRMMQLFIPFPTVLTNSSIFALTLLPVFSGLYYYYSHAKAFKNVGKYIVFLVVGASVLFAVTTCINPMAPLQMLPYYLFFMGLYMITIFISIPLEALKTGHFLSTSVCGIIGFGCCGLIELALYFSNIKGYHQSNFLTLGLLWFCVAMAADTIQNFARVYQSAIKVETLSILAYTDGLTGLKNRTAFLERISILGASSESLVTLAMFDINDLKDVNDTHGHLVGDAMLRHSAKAIKSSLRQEDELYRIGGDEFVAVIRHSRDFNACRLEERMHAVLQTENQKPLSYRLNIAYGCATFSESADKTLFETLARADEKMYACKDAQKGIKR